MALFIEEINKKIALADFELNEMGEVMDIVASRALQGKAPNISELRKVRDHAAKMAQLLDEVIGDQEP